MSTTIDSLLGVLNPGDGVYLSHTVYSPNDGNPHNNEAGDHMSALLSYDPNRKSVYPVGECVQGYVLEDQELTYTIEFQNTGEAPALNVYIMDTLDTNLDILYLCMIAYE